MPYRAVIRLLGVARNPTNGFPARLLETLGLKQAVEILDNILEIAANKHLTYPEMLEQLR